MKRRVLAPNGESSEAGSYTLEALIYVPFLMLLLAGAAQLGALLTANAEAQNAADAGYFSARVIGGTSEDGVEQATHRLNVTSTLKDARVEVQRDRDQTTVTVTGTASGAPPFLPAMTITRQAQGPSEEALR
ncbi:TadE/TadG family type IV pilus assembly protein [Rothia mucilaginosa]|uniref:Pilus assembly protein n=1 Tax=Rothia mucilaginosa TaxID=43675 RepID=A0A930KW90_9MICC|nr:TadE family protein [Rothia mucilaginosa]MBF1658133.1 pilus assembly protein [Rothia mucilaginosa]